MSPLQRAVKEYMDAQEGVQDAVKEMLRVERMSADTVKAHEALRSLGEALLAAQEATRRFALVLAFDPEQMVADGDLDALVPPIIEHEESEDSLVGWTACWKPGVAGGHCRKPVGHEDSCACY